MKNGKLRFWAIFFLCLIVVSVSACRSTSSSSNTESTNFPTKPFKVMTPFDPGAASDMQLRIISKHAKKHLGVEMVIENVPGAGGQVGWNQFTKAKNDGHELAAVMFPHIIVMPLVNNTEFKTDTFEPVFLWNTDPAAIAVVKESKYQTLQDLIDDAKNNPEKITVGSGGVLGAHHLLIMALEEAAGIKVTHLPQASMNGVLSSMYGKHIDVGSGNTTDYYQNKDKIRVLAVASKERSPLFPDVPTFEELGFGDVFLSVDRGIAVPKGTPEEIRKQLETGFMNLAKDPEFVAEAEKAGIVLTPQSGTELKEDIPQRTEFLTNLLKKVGTIK